MTKAHALEEKEISKMSRRMNSIAEKGYRLDILNANFGASTWIVFTAFQIICLTFSGIMALNGKISVGDISLYQSYFTTIVSSVSSLISLLPLLSKGMESVNSIGEILRDRDVEENAGKKKLQSIAGDYELKDVCFSYEKNKGILKGISLKVNAGETVALVGGSGAGKSTVLNMIIGFIHPDSGVVTVDGNDIKSIDLQSYRSHLAVVPQTSILFSGTIRDNITYGISDISQEKLDEAVRSSELTELIDSLPDGLDTLVGEHGGRLSGGQRQRISIARAIIRNPDVILFDEATSALDSVTEQKIQRAMDNLTKDRTTFIVAHRLSTIRNADKIAVLDGGKCIEFGSYDELMEKKGEFYKLRQLQME
ncbi:MAG: ABC transporter ATP-binding protein [Acutalibacteraceae bacterium]